MKSSVTKPNFSIDEDRAVGELNGNKKIPTGKADKEEGLVLLDSVDYNHKSNDRAVSEFAGIACY